MELIKESNFNENDSFSAAALPLHQLFSANSPNVPQNLNELSKSLLTLINNTSTSNAQLGVASTHHPSTNPDLTKSSASTSNDESVDSQTCNGDDGNHKKTRCRRRKPQKTIRMANDATTTPLANGNCTENNSQSQKSSAKPAEDTSQTQSMDLSNYSAGHDAFSNGKLANSIYSATAAKPMNGFASMNMSRYPDPSNSMASASSNHLKAAFNTDDLVKRVEEIVKCNSNDAPTNFSAPRSDDENKSSIGPLSNGGDKNGDIIQPATVETRSSETKMNGNENGIDLKTSHETDAKKSKTSLDEVPLMPNAEVKLPEISLPVANSTPKHNHVEEVENHLEKMFSHIENVTVSAASDTTTTATTSTSTNAGADDTTQNESENQNSQTNNDTNNDSELTAKSNDQPATSSTAATPSTSRKKPPRSRKRPAASGRKKVGQSARRPPNKSNTKANGKNAAKNSNASKNNKNVKSNRNAEKSDSKKAKEELAAAESVAKFRGPYIQIQEDGSECIINAPITEEIIEKQNKNRKIVIHSGSGARSKVSGLHVSTLSTKYDAITTDASWMCVFCKLGPHKYGLGDLFGPFILSVDSEEFQESQFDPSEDVFRSHRTNADMVQVKGGMKVVPAKASTSSAATANNTGNVSYPFIRIIFYFLYIILFLSILQSSCRKKRKLTEPSTSTAPPIIVPDIFHGMTKVSEIAYEVWVHEDCVVWSDGVYIVGARIVGLDAAVWSCSRHKCSICEQYGAAVTCFERGCKIEAHVPCAKRSHWSLNEANFQTHCKQHAIAEVDGADTARSDEERQ